VRALSALAVLVLTLAPVSSATAPGPCTLLTNKEVSAAFASRVVAHNSEPVGLAASCVWTGTPLANQYGQASARLTVFSEPKRNFVRFEREANGEAVKGVGDAAIWVQQIAQLSAWYRGYSVSVTVGGPSVTSPLTAAKQLTKAALAHL
jgi:hypothetical protein